MFGDTPKLGAYAENVMNALKEAIEITKDCKYRRTFHSDQGWAY